MSTPQRTLMRDAAAELMHAQALTRATSEITVAAANETQLRHEIESALRRACAALGIAWTPFQLDRRLGPRSKIRFVDVAHGAVVIEYEPPSSFKGREGAALAHARAQCEEYALMLCEEEGRPLGDYMLVAWDGASICFGRAQDRSSAWERLTPFDTPAAQRLLDALARNGAPLVHPRLLAQLAGPESACGSHLIPALFDALIAASRSNAPNKTQLLFAEWRRLFGQVVGVQSVALQRLLSQQGTSHARAYGDEPAAYLFALHTYIALLAKLVAACALPDAAQDVRDRAVPVAQRIGAIESGQLFVHAGIANMLAGDFFSWLLDDPAWPGFEAPIDELIASLAGVDFDVSRKSAASTRDLFKGIYESCVPRPLRHALGEFYTPDWLAEHALDAIGWTPADSMLDPTCGSGTFVLEALRRRLSQPGHADARQLLHGLHGFDLNPLAVLSAKASLAVYIAPYLSASRPVRLPIYLADAINPAQADMDGALSHVLQTEIGPRSFRLPLELVRHDAFFTAFSRIRELIDEHFDAARIVAAIEREHPTLLSDDTQRGLLLGTTRTLCELHQRGWNGIWCPIVADRFAAGAIERAAFVCGNPPWVKWSHLPPEYAAFIGPRCRRLGVFSSDTWVGGIESDMSTVVTFEVIDNFLADGGKLAFFITATVFANESSEGFRHFRLHDGAVTCRVLGVEDFEAIAPFDGVTARPALLMLQRGPAMEMPVAYRVWKATDEDGTRLRTFKSAAEFRRLASCTTLQARPVPGGHGERPWLVGTEDDHEVFAKVFTSSAGHYVARKGVTTDRNGIYWVRPEGPVRDGLVRVRNSPDIGRTRGIAQRRALVEAEHVFPLLRGRGVQPFRAQPDADLRILLPQRGMHGDPDLAENGPHTLRYLKAFKTELEARSSYRRFQARAGHPYYSLWSTGAYTFEPFKVLWREMGGGSFAAAYVGQFDDPLLGSRLVIPDHKLYFIPVATEAEAAYLTGLLNAPLIARAVGAYASQLSLGASVAEYVHLPPFVPSDPVHGAIAKLTREITIRGSGVSDDELHRLDSLAHDALGSKTQGEVK